MTLYFKSSLVTSRLVRPLLLHRCLSEDAPPHRKTPKPSLLDHSVLFVSRRNVIRAPMAKAVFMKLLNEKALAERWQVDSAALLAWHLGSEADQRALEVLRTNSYQLSGHRVRQIEEQDFNLFDFILAMDSEDMFDLRRLAPPRSKASRKLLGSYDPKGEIYIDDPFHTKSLKTFSKTLDHCKRCCENFLKSLPDSNP